VTKVFSNSPSVGFFSSSSLSFANSLSLASLASRSCRAAYSALWTDDRSLLTATFFLGHPPKNNPRQRIKMNRVKLFLLMIYLL